MKPSGTPHIAASAALTTHRLIPFPSSPTTNPTSAPAPHASGAAPPFLTRFPSPPIGSPHQKSSTNPNTQRPKPPAPNPHQLSFPKGICISSSSLSRLLSFRSNLLLPVRTRSICVISTKGFAQQSRSGETCRSPPQPLTAPPKPHTPSGTATAAPIASPTLSRRSRLRSENTSRKLTSTTAEIPAGISHTGRQSCPTAPPAAVAATA